MMEGAPHTAKNNICCVYGVPPGHVYKEGEEEAGLGGACL